MGTCIEGGLIGGGMGSLWYRQLDEIVTHRLKLVPGSFRFIATKLGLECILWKPVVLFTFWMLVSRPYRQLKPLLLYMLIRFLPGRPR
jgi:hypothetical protein